MLTDEPSITHVFLQVFAGDLAIAAAIVLVAGFARGFTGFAGALINVGLLTLLYGPVEAVGLSAIFAVVSSALVFPTAARDATWRDAGPVALFNVLAVPFGTVFLLTADPSTVKPIIGAVIMLAGLVLYSGWVYRGPRGLSVSCLVGASAGVLSGITGAGPMIVFYFLAAPDPPAVQRANIAISIAPFGFVLAGSLYLGGGFDLETLARGLVLVPGTIVGTWAGIRFFAIAPQKVYTNVAQLAVIATGMSVVLFSIAG